MQVAPGLVGPAGLRTAHHDELAPFQKTGLHRSCQPGPRLQDTELARISQAGMPDILQWASWRSAKPRTAVVVRQLLHCPGNPRQPQIRGAREEKAHG